MAFVGAYAVGAGLLIPGSVLTLAGGALSGLVRGAILIIGDVAAVAGGAQVPHDLAYWIFIAVGLVATIAVSVLVTRIARRALQEESDGGEQPQSM